MTDEALRSLEQRWKASGSSEDELAYLLARLRTTGHAWKLIQRLARLSPEAAAEHYRTHPKAQFCEHLEAGHATFDYGNRVVVDLIERTVETEQRRGKDTIPGQAKLDPREAEVLAGLAAHVDPREQEEVVFNNVDMAYSEWVTVEGSDGNVRIATESGSMPYGCPSSVLHTRLFKLLPPWP